MKGIYGRVIAVLNIDERGTVTKCRIVATAGKELNEETCSEAMHIRYKPAHDAAGRNVASLDVLAVRWELP